MFAKYFGIKLEKTCQNGKEHGTNNWIVSALTTTIATTKILSSIFGEIDCHFGIYRNFFQFISNCRFIVNSWYYSGNVKVWDLLISLELISFTSLNTKLLNRIFNVLENFLVFYVQRQKMPWVDFFCRSMPLQTKKKTGRLNWVKIAATNDMHVRLLILNFASILVAQRMRIFEK